MVGGGAPVLVGGGVGSGVTTVAGSIMVVGSGVTVVAGSIMVVGSDVTVRDPGIGGRRDPGISGRRDPGIGPNGSTLSNDLYTTAAPSCETVRFSENILLAAAGVKCNTSATFVLWLFCKRVISDICSETCLAREIRSPRSPAYCHGSIAIPTVSKYVSGVLVQRRERLVSKSFTRVATILDSGMSAKESLI